MMFVCLVTNVATPPSTSSTGPGPAKALLEIYVDRGWRTAGEVRVVDPRLGIPSPATFEYDLDYLDRAAEALGARDLRAVSCRYPVGYEPFDETRWPAVLLDLIPSGAARRHWVGRLGLADADGADWSVLLAGAAHAPGNVRVASALDRFEGPSEHPGFPRRDILERREDFIEYAHQCGAPVSGSTGAGGDSPKFLLREDRKGSWHAYGVLPDERTARCWLVKFPRTRQASDRLILQAEAAYHQVARRFGLRASGRVEWERDCLFVERFDRVVDGEHVDRLGLESVCSLAGVAEFGVPVPKETLAGAIAKYVTDPPAELREFVARDVLDVALGNTDNHGRNTSVLKKTDGTIALAPLYDFAPMILDERGIARVCRWQDGSDNPDWNAVARFLGTLGLDAPATREWLRGLGPRVSALPAEMREQGVAEAVLERCAPRIERVAQALARVEP
jgi:serine/threonine-protein kinase HipA